MEPLAALKTYFGYDSFRTQQQTIIDHVLSGRHALVIMPTGMGKSLCFQIPALIHAESSDKRSLTLVLSPLIALMKDQVDALRRRGIAATFVNSSLSRAEREQRYASIGNGEHAILYVTPERFRKPEFLDVIAERNIQLLAVDEAHCISEWGHDFRPDYTRLAEIRELIGNPTTIALTATATPDVQVDIVKQLGLTDDEVRLFHEGIDRPNLQLQVQEVLGDEEKLAQVLDVHSEIPGSGIVYFTLIKTLVRFSDHLKECGIKHLVYHGDLPRNERRYLQEQFMSKPDQLVLATNAFGMGIDKEDVRYIIHADVPGSMESYYQEIGRAGRDGLPSTCLLLYDQNDLMTQMEFLGWSNPDALFYDRVYDFLQNELEQVNAFGIDWLRERLHHKNKFDHRLETALAMLERHGVIEGTLSPLNVEVVADLPTALQDQERLNAKLRRDQQKLYTLVEYVNCEDDRKAFINRYFGVGVTAE